MLQVDILVDDLDVRRGETDRTAVRYAGLSRALVKLIVLKPNQLEIY